MNEVEYVEVSRWAVERVRAYILAATDEAGSMEDPEFSYVLAALDEALA